MDRNPLVRITPHDEMWPADGHILADVVGATDPASRLGAGITGPLATKEDPIAENAGFGTTAGPKSEMATNQPSGFVNAAALQRAERSRHPFMPCDPRGPSAQLVWLPLANLLRANLAPLAALLLQ
jgi:hypothetical protein